MEEAVNFRTEVEDIKDAMEEAYLADVTDVDLAMNMEEEEKIGAVDNMLKWCDAMTDHNWRFTRHMNPLTMTGTGYLMHKE